MPYIFHHVATLHLVLPYLVHHANVLTAVLLQGAFFGALVADALTLGTHYEYDAKKIKQFYGMIDKYYAPGEKTGGETHGIGWGARNYHGGNGRGEPKMAGGYYKACVFMLLYMCHHAKCRG